ncbi:hypothetical protein [Corynebacterium doosanense]|uniref:Uncharacterized protein n=1 Tax=Corynebacterium doosanense CAU 212 = DSM 45436 TaxID=558173 RepID=A0A097IJR4_9CORY|nr:hypothetical protein [Corynebacterium doosanense]AIT62343.1 hypothetical protein CDOO_12130 [Corynebacterium doosanense CAU 212 = DSM 45436]
MRVQLFPVLVLPALALTACASGSDSPAPETTTTETTVAEQSSASSETAPPSSSSASSSSSAPAADSVVFEDGGVRFTANSQEFGSNGEDTLEVSWEIMNPQGECAPIYTIMGPGDLLLSLDPAVNGCSGSDTELFSPIAEMPAGTYEVTVVDAAGGVNGTFPVTYAP